MKKKGYAMVLDSVFALTFTLVVLIGLGSYTQYRTEETGFKRLHYLSEDVFEALNKQGILDDVGEDWAASNGTINSSEWISAQNISNTYLDQLIPEHIGYRLTIDDVTIAESSGRTSEGNAVVKTHSNRLLVGYGKGLPTRGYVSRAYITNIVEKTTSLYTYFGGYVGQGNITQYVRGLPDDATVIQACWEGNFGSAFNFYINDASAGSFTPSGGSMEANVKGSSGCVSSPDDYFNKGADNKLDLKFTSTNISQMYIGGGFFRVTYNTTEADTADEEKNGYYWFPGIRGLINHYSSVYVPGELNSMEAYVHFDSNYTTYVTMGDTVVLNTSNIDHVTDNCNVSDSEYMCTLSNADLSVMLDYDDIELKTTPLRVGTENVSYTITQGNADVVLITDLSGSMRRCVQNNNNCVNGDPNQRFTLAKLLDKVFVSSVLNASGNRVGLVSYNWEADKEHDLSSDGSSLNSTIDSFSSPDGATCTCCAVRMARIMLEEQSSEDRDQYIILMTDGIANRRCSPTDLNRTDCCTTGYCPSPSCGSGRYWSADCYDTVDDTGKEDAIEDVCIANNETGAIVNTIGFGAGAIGCDYAIDGLNRMATCGNGSYCASDDPVELANCYLNFSSQIVTSSQESQTIVISSFEDMTLYEDSYIYYGYEPYNTSGYGEVSLTLETDYFNDTVDCNGYIYIPDDMRVVDAKVTSYSSSHWTDYLSIENGGLTEPYKLWVDYPGVVYTNLGDPYTVQIPPSLFSDGMNHTVEIQTGDNSVNRTGCSADDKAIYTLKARMLVQYGNVFQYSDGCIWTIGFEDDTELTATIPSSYNGTEECYYTPTNLTSNSIDTIDDSVYRLLRHLDVDDNGQVDVVFNPDSINFESSSAGGVKSLWGPTKFKLILWM